MFQAEQIVSPTNTDDVAMTDELTDDTAVSISSETSAATTSSSVPEQMIDPQNAVSLFPPYSFFDLANVFSFTKGF